MLNGFMNHLRIGLNGFTSIFCFVRKDEGRSPSSSGSVRSAIEKMRGISSLGESLQTTCDHVESNFLQLGLKLQSIYSDTTELTREVIETLELIGGESKESILTKANWLAGESSSKLLICRDQVFSNLSHINDIIEQLEELSKRSRAIEKIALSFKVVGLYMGIESSTLMESGVAFKALGQEIKELYQKVTQIAKKILKDSEDSQRRQISAYHQVTRGMEQLHSLSDETEQTVQHAVREIKQLMGLYYDALGQSHENTRKISQQVGEIVVGIQLHDSMRQRIEHIIKAFYAGERLCSGNGEDFTIQGKTPAELPERLGSVHTILDLQAAQLKRVIGEIHSVHQKCVGAFEKIHTEVNSLVNSLAVTVLDISYKSGEVSETGIEATGLRETHEDPFMILKLAMQHLQHLLHQGQELFDQTLATSMQTSNTASRLMIHTQDVRRISLETHLKALNSIIKAAHLEEDGKPLEVLAQEMKRLSDQTKMLVENVEEILSCIHSSTREQDSEDMEGRNANSRLSPSDSDPFSSLIGDMLKGYTRLQENALNTFHHAEVLKSAISRTNSSLHFLPALADELTGQVSRLEEIINALSPWGKEASTGFAEEMDELAKRYTMQQERQVHGQVIEYEGQSLDVDNEDFGDNVELF